VFVEVALRYATIREEQARWFTLGWPLLRRAVLRLGEGAEPVNPGETGRLKNYGAGETSTGLLIQAGPGNDGGTGGWRTKRSG